MVVLEGGGNIVTIGNNQYLQPDYMSPLQTTLDAKKSPLALLAQTCSQIGADSSAVKPLLSVDNKKKNESQSKSPTAKVMKTNVSSEIKLAFKPYETNVLTQSTNSIPSKSAEDLNGRPNSKASLNASESGLSNDENKTAVGGGGESRASSRSKSRSPEISVVNNNENSCEQSDNLKTGSPNHFSQRSASPIIRSGMEVLNGQAQGGPYKNGMYGLNSLAALCCPPGMESHANPAFRTPYSTAYAHHHQAAMLAAASGYATSASTQNPYISYQRVKTASGVEAIVPVCKDPYCTGCPYSAHNQQMMLGTPCPNGCTQCEHQKYGLAMAASLGALQSNPYASQIRSPYVCSWIAGESYCGKRFNTSDELFSHLRTHTGNLSDPAAAAAALAHSQTQSLLSTFFPPSALSRYSNAPLSPISAARYHPYSKPGSLSAAMPGPQFATFNPAAAAALGQYYGPYALYGPRIGSATVHP